jgi:hypothetical protein
MCFAAAGAEGKDQVGHATPVATGSSAHLHTELELQLAARLFEPRALLLAPCQRGAAVVRSQRLHHLASATEDVQLDQWLV